MGTLKMVWDSTYNRLLQNIPNAIRGAMSPVQK
jgi:hypothetical protein